MKAAKKRCWILRCPTCSHEAVTFTAPLFLCPTYCPVCEAQKRGRVQLVEAAP